MSTEDALAALNAGIENAGATPVAPETNNEPDTEIVPDELGDGAPGLEEGDGDAGDGDAETGTEGELPDGDGADADATGESEADRGDGRNAKGEWVKKNADGTLAPEPKSAVAPKAPAAAKDPINDPIPKDLKKETQERMVSLIDTAKKLTAQNQQITANFNEVMGYIQDSGATPQQYGQALDYLKMVNSGDPAQIEKCMTFMQGELSALSRMLGKPVAGVDLLADHADLSKRVADGEISRQDAEELAAARNHGKFRQHQATVTRQSQQDQQAEAQVRNKAMADLNALETQLKAQDKGFAYKRPLVLAKLQTVDPVSGKTLIQRTHPSQWEALFLREYALVKVPAARPSTGTQKPGTKVPQNQPLRARNPAGGSVAAPKSLFEAVSMGIDSVGR